MRHLPLLCTAVLCALIFAWNARWRTHTALAAERAGMELRLAQANPRPTALEPGAGQASANGVEAFPGADGRGAGEERPDGGAARDPRARIELAGDGTRRPTARDAVAEEASEASALREARRRRAAAADAPPDRSRVVQRFENGEPSAEGEVIDGAREGAWVEYWPGGELRSQGRFEADQRVDEWRFWHDNGTLEATGRFVAGSRDGEWRSYDREGRAKTHTSYRRGRRDGYEREWFSNGQIRSEGVWRNAVREGDWRFYDFQGRLDHRSGYYEAGRRVR